MSGLEGHHMELVRALPDDWGKGFAELYRRDGEYIVVSTILVGAGLDAAQTALVQMGNMAGAMLGEAPGGLGEEETMAFAADENGEVDDWGEIAAATGEGSRAQVLAELGSER